MSDIRAHNLHVHVGTLLSMSHYFHLEHGECEALVGDQVRREEREMRRLLLTQRVQQLELVPQVELNTNLKQDIRTQFRHLLAATRHEQPALYNAM